MTLWKSFGASVRGPAHVAAGTPNQDAWASFHRGWGDGIVIADGVGSKTFADFGSAAACRAALHAAHACRDHAEIDPAFLSDQIRSSWLSRLAPLDPRDCAATCLFAFRLGDGAIHLGMLGDGLAAAVTTAGAVLQLTEDKADGFSNLTTALSATASARDWRYLSIQAEVCAAVLLCTDGVADDLVDVDGFAQGFLEAYGPLAPLSANREVRAMLAHWPTPRHSDDKTIACLCRNGVADA